MRHIAVNRVPALLVERLGCPVLAVRGQQVPVRALVRQRPGLRRHLGRPVVLGVRPGDVRDAMERRPAAAGSAALVLHGTVRDILPVGRHRLVHLELADGEGLDQPAPTLVARMGGGWAARVGSPIMLGIDLARLMLFDAHTGRSLW
ncbi:TOBE domain-containing protein [Dactylosporangium sp. NPDC000244]|uniref:TOBE domain-containing protein n=1 Tax=Dactylosporangium sp. NPDC000244 TaxID=3154365 RepID=UPI003319B81D